MKKTILGFLVASSLMMTSCLEDIATDLVGTYPFDELYEIDQTGAFEESRTLSVADVTDEIDFDGEVKSVGVNSVKILVTVNSGNTAESVDLFANISSGGISYDLFTKTVDLTSFTVGQEQEFILNPELNSAAVTLFTLKIKEIINGTFDVNEQFTISVGGDTNPSTSTVNATVRLLIDSECVYTTN